VELEVNGIHYKFIPIKDLYTYCWRQH